MKTLKRAAMFGACAVFACACSSGRARIVAAGGGSGGGAGVTSDGRPMAGDSARTGGAFAAASRSELANLLVCADSLGRDGTNVVGGRCMPCLPYEMEATAESAARQARRMWSLVGRAPSEASLHRGTACAGLAYDFARAASPGDIALNVEVALYELALTKDSVRALAFARIDGALDSLVSAGDRRTAARLLELLGRGMWERAQRMLERPSMLQLDAWEESVHDLTSGVQRFRRLPALPRTSSRIGVSEAEWSARLFDMAASLSDLPVDVSRRHRLALAPWVVMARWPALDSAARRMLARAPNDSTVLPARALAAHYQVRRPVQEQPAVMALFDSALSRMPRADSLRYDSFDGVLGAADDEWRYGFLPSEREKLDRRGWSVLDPIWSTPLNELRLAKRARVAEADYRFADIAADGQAGSETAAGTMLLRRGTAEPAWSTDRRGTQRRIWRDWPGLRAMSASDDVSDFYRAFYSGRLAPAAVAAWQAGAESGCPSTRQYAHLVDCALASNTDWTGTPFWGRSDTVDVSMARFRASGDSVDLYIGARLPLRRFKHRDEPGAERSDRIRFGAWLATPLGETVFHREGSRELPPQGLIAWTSQWTTRVAHGELMHRVEALEPTRPTGARGAVLYTSDEQVTIPLRGSGMSDVLVAATARETRTPARRWSDIAFTPNGGVVAAGAPFELAWELYELAPAPDGRVRWKVAIHREQGSTQLRGDVRAAVAGERTAGTRLVAEEPDAPAVSYTRDAPAADAVVEHIRFNMGGAPPGRHVIEVRITDLVSGRTMKRSASVRVLGPDAQKRTTSD